MSLVVVSQRQVVRSGVRGCWVALAVLSLCGAAQCQRVWIVDLFQRQGADFPDLPAAVAAAGSGDIIRLRGTTTSVVDSYLAPSIQGKALAITGDGNAPRPIVTGSWDIQGLGATQAVTVKGLQLTGMLSFPTGRVFRIVGSSDLGSIVLDDIIVPPSLYEDVGLYHGITGTRFIDCNMVVIRNSTIETGGGPWTAIRSTLMLDGTLMRSDWVTGSVAGGTIFTDNSRLHLSNSTIIGLSGLNATFYIGTSAIWTCGSEIVTSGNTTLEGGVPVGFPRQPAIAPGCDSVGILRVPSQCHIDPTTVLLGGMFPPPLLIYDPSRQTGLSAALSATTLAVDHYVGSSSLGVLAMGAVQASPWSYVVGPVFIDPTGVTTFLDAAPASGPLHRSFAVPPGLPLGTTACLQAFELLPSGTLLTSNATVVGVW